MQRTLENLWGSPQIVVAPRVVPEGYVALLAAVDTAAAEFRALGALPPAA